MWVYADREVDWCVAEQVRFIADEWRRAMAMPASLARHALIVSLLIRAGMLWQAREDQAFRERGFDVWPKENDPARALTLECAQRVCESVASNGQDMRQTLSSEALRAMSADERVLRTRIPEGYAFYDLYPEFMIAPAQLLPKGESICVVGLRSIGTSLAAMVAAASHKTQLVSLRPTGEPFDRQVSTNDDWKNRLSPFKCVAIADEGPGLSGSSFAAAGRAARQAKAKRVIYFPTHSGNPGVAAVPQDRALWLSEEKYVADRQLFQQEKFNRAHWFSDIIGLALRITDVSGGRWRAQLNLPPEEWPAADIAQERVKYVLETDSGFYLMKFKGLTPLSDHQFNDASDFAQHGFGLKPIAERHGMMLWPWVRRARPLNRYDKPHVLPLLSAMLGFRARAWRVAKAGSSVHDLWEMARVNLTQTFGADASRWIEPWHSHLDDIEEASVPIKIDGRLDCHEFIASPHGKIVKTDALDHHAGHDLIGCQDVLWDIAGAAVEWGLKDSEISDLICAISHAANRNIRSEYFEFYRITYCAFRIGLATMAMEALSSTDPEESTRFEKQVKKYRKALMFKSYDEIVDLN